VVNFYGVVPKNLQRQYRDYVSEFKAWNQKSHAKSWLSLAQNIESRLSLDETAFSNGDVYTILINKIAKGKKGVIIAMVKGSKAKQL
jgi:transposase